MARKPSVLVVVVNYNSGRIIGIVKESLKYVLSLRYRPMKLVLVDNGSTDGSFEEVLKVVEERPNKDVEVGVLKLSKNYGFAVANNMAFLLYGKDFDYIALINNDLAPNPDSLDRLIEYLEAHPVFVSTDGIFNLENVHVALELSLLVLLNCSIRTLLALVWKLLEHT